MNNIYQCLECGVSISKGIHQFSRDIHGVPLCIQHQLWIAGSGATDEAIILYFALKSNKVPVILGYSDSRKKIDIALPGKLYIEVDDKNHYGSEQPLTEFPGTYYSWKEKIPTIRIPISVIHDLYKLRIIVDRLAEMCRDYKQTG